MRTNLLLLLGSGFQELNSSVQEEVYREFYRFLYGPIFYLIRDHQATEDVIQDSFFAVLKKPPDAETDEHMRAWIKVVSKNAAINYLRKNKKYRNNVSLESEWIMNHSPASPNAESVEKEIETKSLEEHIARHIGDLKPDQREILEMKWKQALSYKEIAANIDETENSVRRKLHRARAFLKKKLRSDWGEYRE